MSCQSCFAIYLLLFLSVANFADATSVTPKVLALRLQTTDDKSFYNKEGQITFESNQDLKLEIISEGVNDGTYIKLITEKMDMGSNCDNGNGLFHASWCHVLLYSTGQLPSSKADWPKSPLA